MHNWGSQKTVVPTCKQTAHLACAFYPGLGCNLISIGWFWIIDIDVSRNDYKNDASFNWCDLAFQGLYAYTDMLAVCMMSCWIGGPWNLNRLNLTASARAPHHGAHPLQHCAALFCRTCLGHGGQHLVTIYPHWLWLVVEPPLYKIMYQFGSSAGSMQYYPQTPCVAQTLTLRMSCCRIYDRRDCRKYCVQYRQCFPV